MGNFLVRLYDSGEEFLETEKEGDMPILPCPFCNSIEFVKISPPVNDPPKNDIVLNSYAVTCRQCLCIGPNCADLDDAVRMWNGRPRREVDKTEEPSPTPSPLLVDAAHRGLLREILDFIDDGDIKEAIYLIESELEAE